MRLTGSAGLLRAWLVFAAAVFGTMLMPTAARADPPGRLFYEMAVTGPDTRSQGWNGVLYDANGNPVQAQYGQTVTTPLGDFVDVPCETLWAACGMIRVDMAEWMKVHPANTPVVGGSNDWLYRMYVSGESSADPQWKSTLVRAGTEIPPASAPVDTPMGPFRTGGVNAVGWVRAGWFPVSWQPPPPQQ